MHIAVKKVLLLSHKDDSHIYQQFSVTLAQRIGRRCFLYTVNYVTQEARLIGMSRVILRRHVGP